MHIFDSKITSKLHKWVLYLTTSLRACAAMEREKGIRPGVEFRRCTAQNTQRWPAGRTCSAVRPAGILFCRLWRWNAAFGGGWVKETMRLGLLASCCCCYHWPSSVRPSSVRPSSGLRLDLGFRVCERDRESGGRRTEFSASRCWNWLISSLNRPQKNWV